MSREYGMSYPDVLAMPLRTFWSFNRQVDRLRAEQEVRMLRLHSAVGGEGAAELMKQLQLEMSNPVLIEKGFDEAKFLELQKKFHGGA